MRRILAATVLASPFILSAAALTSQPVTDATASTARPISTGVTPAKVLYTPNIDFSPDALDIMPNGAEIVLTLNVDEKGRPQDVQVVKSPSHYLDETVAASVRNYRFSPATLDKQPIALPLTLTVLLQH